MLIQISHIPRHFKSTATQPGTDEFALLRSKPNDLLMNLNLIAEQQKIKKIRLPDVNSFFLPQTEPRLA